MDVKIKIYQYANCTTQRCPEEIMKIFMIKRFFHLLATGVNDSGSPPWAANMSANFRKNSKRAYWYNQDLGGNWFMKKTRSKISRDTVPLKKNAKTLSFFSNLFAYYLLTLHDYRKTIFRTVLRSRIRDPVPFWPLDPGSGIGFSGSRIPNPYILEHIENFLGKNFNNSLKIGPNFFFSISKIT